MRVGGVAGNPALDTRVRINDPIGRFGRAFSPDVRFTIDEDNPTIHTHNFYPMCLPRTNPASADDPLCPQKNRPKDLDREIREPVHDAAAGQRDRTRRATDGAVRSRRLHRLQRHPDHRRHADRTIAAHTIVSNMTIMTAPGTQPAYVGIEVLLMGVSTKAGAPPGTEGAVRTRVEGFSTDVTLPTSCRSWRSTSIPCSGAESERTWGFAAIDVLVALGRFRFRPELQGRNVPARHPRVARPQRLGHGAGADAERPARR